MAVTVVVVLLQAVPLDCVRPQRCPAVPAASAAAEPAGHRQPAHICCLNAHAGQASADKDLCDLLAAYQSCMSACMSE